MTTAGHAAIKFAEFAQLIFIILGSSKLHYFQGNNNAAIVSFVLSHL